MKPNVAEIKQEQKYIWKKNRDFKYQNIFNDEIKKNSTDEILSRLDIVKEKD